MAVCHCIFTSMLVDWLEPIYCWLPLWTEMCVQIRPGRTQDCAQCSVSFTFQCTVYRLTVSLLISAKHSLSYNISKVPHSHTNNHIWLVQTMLMIVSEKGVRTKQWNARNSHIPEMQRCIHAIPTWKKYTTHVTDTFFPWGEWLGCKWAQVLWRTLK